MKKILLLIIFITSLKSYSQADSNTVKIGVAITFKELNYLGSFIYNNDDLFGDLADTVKVKYRGQADPSEATNVTITGTIGAWLAVVNRLRSDNIAILNNVFKKIDDALKLLTTQTFLIRQLAIHDAADVATYQAVKQFGKFKNRRQ